jgi:biotin carboxyl carrier protein
MADIFISYAREDRDFAAALAEVIRKEGWSVWWDRKIQVGRSFSDVIERELEAARCVVVLWSRTSIKSEWVLVEAAEGAARQILVPIRIEDVRPPLEFRRLHTATVLDYHAGTVDQGINDCLSAIAALVGENGSLQRIDPQVTHASRERMAHDVVMPQMGESTAEGTVSKWLKNVGDKVERDEPLLEISTDKVDAEIPSPAAGTLTEILVKEGVTVPVNAVVARIAAEDEAAASATGSRTY